MRRVFISGNRVEHYYSWEPETITEDQRRQNRTTRFPCLNERAKPGPEAWNTERGWTLYEKYTIWHIVQDWQPNE